jgi:RNA polymerase sigma-70 factor (ECF subfamily)
MLYTQGRSECFELLVRRYAQELMNCVYRLVGSSAAAEDVVQETFLQLHLSADRFDTTRKLRPWMFTIAVNKARDALRTRKRQREMSLDQHAGALAEGPSYGEHVPSTAPRPGMVLEIEERSLRIRERVEQLPEHLREVLILGYYNGFSYKEMADIVDVPLGTIKSRLHAAVRAFGKLTEAHQAKESDAEAQFEQYD